MAAGPPKAFSLVASNVGDVNAVNVPVPSCDNYTTVNARTVYAGTHVQILADTSLTNWPQQYRPDSLYYGALGLEYDTLTYATVRDGRWRGGRSITTREEQAPRQRRRS